MLSYTIMSSTGHNNVASPSSGRHKKRAHSRALLIASWFFVAAMLCIIFYMSSKSGEAIDTGSGLVSIVRNALIAVTTSLFGHAIDVSPIGHFTEFFLLGLALVNALRLTFPLGKASIYALVGASVYGASDELHQIFVPGRTCDPMDWLIDTIAAALAIALFALIVRLKRKRRNSPT